MEDPDDWPKCGGCGLQMSRADLMAAHRMSCNGVKVESLEAKVERLELQVKELTEKNVKLQAEGERVGGDRDLLKRQVCELTEKSGVLTGWLKDSVDKQDAAELEKDELLKAADALLGKMGGINTPVCPEYEDEFLVLELLVDKLNSNDVESIEKRLTENPKDKKGGS